MSLQIGRMFFRKPTGSTVELAIHFANEIFKCVNSCNKIGIQLKNLLIFECKNIISNIVDKIALLVEKNLEETKF